MPMFLVIMSRVFGMFLSRCNPKLVADVSCVTGPTRVGYDAFLQRLEILDQVPLFRCGEFCSVIVTRIRVAACSRVENVSAFICVAHRVFIEHMRTAVEAHLALLRWREQILHHADRAI